jgi:protein SCO1/2
MTMKKSALLFLLALGAAGAFAGCKKAEAPAAVAPAVKTYTGRGKIQAFQSDGKVVVLEHGPIAGFMEAMTMPFELKDPALGKAFKKGDVVDFSLEAGEQGAVVSAMSKAAK